jgi:membrane protease YdiL (CAAX protease family)
MRRQPSRAQLGLVIFILVAALLAPAAARAADPFALSASQSSEDRLAATTLLVLQGDPAALDRLLLLLRVDRDPAVRAGAARAFADTRNPLYQPALADAAAQDPDPQVRATAGRTAHQLWALGRRPRQAAGLSLICPGCGYFHLGEPGRAAAYLGTAAALVAAGIALAANDANGLRLDSDFGPRMTPTTAPLAIPALLAAQNLWFYGVFASYRDARLARGDEGYRYPISDEGLTRLVSAPVRPSVLRRPWFWAGLPLAVGAAIGFTALVSPREVGRGARSLGDGGGVWFLGRHHGTAAGLALGETYYASLFLPVGVGEESLFRGALQPALCESFGLWPGWAATSLLFGGIHVFNFLDQPGGLATAAKGVPFLTLVGSYFGLVAIRTGYRLETSVALHTWYDFLLGTIAFVADPDHQPFSIKIALPF